MKCYAKSTPAVNAGFPTLLLNQTKFCAYLPINRQRGEIRINEHAFTTVVYFEFSYTGRADRLSRFVADVRLSAEGADHMNLFHCYIKCLVWIGTTRYIPQQLAALVYRKYLIFVPPWFNQPRMLLRHC